MDRQKIMAASRRWLAAMSCGSFITSVGVYLWLGRWEPMVWSAGCIGGLWVIQNFVGAIDPYA